MSKSDLTMPLMAAALVGVGFVEFSLVSASLAGVSLVKFGFVDDSFIKAGLIIGVSLLGFETASIMVVDCLTRGLVSWSSTLT